MRAHLRRGALFVLVLGFSVSVGLAQTARTGAVAGAVTDPVGKVVAGASVTVTNEATGAKTSVLSRGDGSYVVPLLLPGAYTVEVSASGFKISTHPHIQVDVTETEALNVKLEVGVHTETVEVHDQAELLQTESSAQGRTTSGEMVQSLPLAVRNYTQIIALNPGVASEVNNAAELGRGTGGFGTGTVSGGTPGSDNNFQMNGVEVNDRQESGSFSGGVGIPNPDSVQEFKVQTSQYDASYGRDAGANVDVVTKGGANQFHGNLWEYFRNTALNANDYFLNLSRQPRGVLNQNQFGFDVGGPIKKNKLLFFTSYQGTRQKNGLSPSCKSTIQGLTGLTDTNRTAVGLGAAFAGQSGSAFGPGPQPPDAADTIQPNGANISAQALAILHIKINGQFLIPSEQGLVTISEPCPFTEDQFVTDADYVQSDKSKFSGRFFFADSDLTQTLPGGQAGNAVPNVSLPTTQNFRIFSLAHTYTFSTRLENEAEIGFHRTFTYAPATSSFSYSDIGASVPSFDDSNPNIMVGSDFNIPGAPGGGTFTRIGENTYDGQDTLSYVAGKNFFRFGGGLSYLLLNRTAAAGSALIFASFPDFLLGLPAGPSGNGGPLSNILGSIDAPGLYPRDLRAWDANAYLQDDIKVSARLTLNLGFRYDREADMTEALGRNTGFDPGLITPYSIPPAAGSLVGYTVSSNYHGTIPTGVTKLDNEYGMKGNGQNTWNPRVGFAWRFPHTNRFVLRGGYGIYHSILTGQPQLNTTLGPPFLQLRQPFAFQNAGASWAQPFQPFAGSIPFFPPYAPTTQLSILTFDPNYRPPMVQEYSLNVQAALARDLVLDVGYSGARGLHMADERTINQACVAGAPVNADGCPSSAAAMTNTTQNIQQRVPYEGFIPTGVIQIQSQGAYWYNALESSLTKRFNRGLQFQVSYTFAKELSTFDGTTSGNNGGVSLGDQNHPLYGPEGFIRPHRFVLSYVYSLPSPSNVHSLLREVFGGWQWSGVTTYQAGHWLTLVAPNPNNIYGINQAIDGAAGPSTASLVSTCSLSQLVTPGSVESRTGVGGAAPYFNQNCVMYPAVSPYATSEPNPTCGGSPPLFNSCPVATGFGNLGRGIARGPDQANWDMSIAKHFLTRWPSDTANVEFRTEFFNAFNHPQFADPNTSLPSGGPNTLGQITSTSVNPRIIQFALRLNF
jgi:hypothetical protein